MKLLLTSTGITNESIKKALEELVEKPLGELKIAFIPTAANVEKGGKEWLIKNFNEFKNLGFKEIDVVEIAVLSEDVLKERLENVDVLVFGGGNNSYLNYWLTKSGLKEMLPEMLKSKVWVGISAGSMVTSKKIELGEFDEKYFGVDDKESGLKGLGLTDFYVSPHFNSPNFPKLRTTRLEEASKDYPDPVYAIDDQTAIKVVDGEIEVISEGEWEKF